MTREVDPGIREQGFASLVRRKSSASRSLASSTSIAMP
jgi:hypothetical protein